MRKPPPKKVTKKPVKKPTQRGKAHSEAVQAEVMAALLSGQLPHEIEKATGIPERTIRDWRRSDKFAELRRIKRDEIDDLVIALLSTNLKGLAHAFQICTTSKEYIEQQSAAEMATLLGVISDKTFLLLDAIARAEEPVEPTED